MNQHLRSRGGKSWEQVTPQGMLQKLASSLSLSLQVQFVWLSSGSVWQKRAIVLWWGEAKRKRGNRGVFIGWEKGVVAGGGKCVCRTNPAPSARLVVYTKKWVCVFGIRAPRGGTTGILNTHTVYMVVQRKYGVKIWLEHYKIESNPKTRAKKSMKS